jgi:hypothetical protein
MEKIEEYYKKVDESSLNFSNLRNEFRMIFKNLLDKESKTDIHGQANLIVLESEILEINKSIEEGLSPSQTYSKDEDGLKIEVYYPEYRYYDEYEKNYFLTRYKQTNNLFLKTEYGLYLYLVGYIKRNEEKIELAHYLHKLVTQYLKNAVSNLIHPALSRWQDAFIILNRAGNPVKNDFEILVRNMFQFFLDLSVEEDLFLTKAEFIVNTFSSNAKNVESFIDANILLNKLESAMKAIGEDSRESIRLGMLIIQFSSKFNLSTSISYNDELGRIYEKIGDDEILNERWSGVHCFSDAIIHYKESKNEEAIKRCERKIDLNKGKFKMGSVAQEVDDEMLERINNHIDNLVRAGDITQVMLFLAGVGVYPRAESLSKQAEILASSNSLLNFVSLLSFDKFGNTVRKYSEPEERKRYHLFSQMNFGCKYGVQIIHHLFGRVVKNDILKIEHLQSFFSWSWLNEEVSWNSGGEIQKVRPVLTVYPGIAEFFNQFYHALKTEGFKPSYVCCIDSMVLKIEYTLRMMCRRLGIPTFKYWYEKNEMISEEKTMSGLLNELEMENFLTQDDILLIKYLFNEKGGFNIRNRIAHGLMDEDEYRLSTALFAFSVLIRLGFYRFED